MAANGRQERAEAAGERACDGGTLDRAKQERNGQEEMSEEQVSRDEEEEEAEEEDAESSVLGLHSHWSSTYEEELETFHDTGDKGEIWFGDSVMATLVEWTASLAARIAASDGASPAGDGDAAAGGKSSGNSADAKHARDTSACGGANGQASGQAAVAGAAGAAADWRVLDIGTGNGVLLHELAKHGFRDLTGTDYCTSAVRLAREVAAHAADLPVVPAFVEDDILDTSLTGCFELVMDKGTLDAIRLHPDGASHKQLYKASVARLVAPNGLLVITSCNSTKDELIAEIIGSQGEAANEMTGPAGAAPSGAVGTAGPGSDESDLPIKCKEDQQTEQGGRCERTEGRFVVLDYVRTYPTFRFGGVEGTRVCTVAFRKMV